MEKQIASLYNPLFLYVRKRINRLEDAEDITQDVFYKLAKSDQEQIKNIKHWVYSIAKNTITDFYRKKRIFSDEFTDLPILEDDELNSASQELSECVLKFIDQLPEEYRYIMRMSELESKSQKEIAKQLNMNYVTVRSKIQRGRKRLKQLFVDCCYVEQGGKGSIIGYKENKGCNTNSCD